MPKIGRGVCSIPGCNGKHQARGWCEAHYARWKRNGHPLAGRTGDGVPLRFFNDSMSNDTDDCIEWPFGTNKTGYAKIWVDGKFCMPTRMACELVYGPPPTDKHQAAHSCGNGHLGCINPKHLRWATPKENSADKYIHGTMRFGESNGSAKLTTAQVHEIRQLRGKMPQHKIGEIYGVAQSTVGRIHRGITWVAPKAVSMIDNVAPIAQGEVK